MPSMLRATLRAIAPVWVLLFVAGPAYATPADVNAQAFYTDARALQSKGVRAMFDKRLKPLTAQMRDAGKRAVAANASATKAGRPLYCVPPAARGLSHDQIIAMLGALPEAERRSSSLAKAWLTALVRTYPC